MQAERLDHFMARANQIYYSSCDPLLEFTTSPEISQMFGEVIGALCIDIYARMGAPDCLFLIEAGPGRGTLMADMLRVIAAAAPAMMRATQVCFIENSPLLRAQQARRVPSAEWHSDLEQVPAGPTILLANEFLDALPIRQFVRADTPRWRERYVLDGQFLEMDSECAAPPSAFEPGDVLEMNEAAEQFCRLSAARVLRDGGVAIIIDYGYGVSSRGDTLQALCAGKPADPLVRPGTRDLTAHVDFSAMLRAARAARVFGPVTQQALLTELGLLARARILSGSNPDQAEAIAVAAHRLTDQAEMGQLFKAIAIAHPSIDALPGFSAS